MYIIKLIFNLLCLALGSIFILLSTWVRFVWFIYSRDINLILRTLTVILIFWRILL
jgi:hypothetical protein